jgi:DNA-binding response OmpR family regulator
VPGRILLVEDDTIIGASLSRALGGAGYDVEWVQDAFSARAAVAKLVPDLVLLDL